MNGPLGNDQWQYDSLLRDWQLTCLENICAFADMSQLAAEGFMFLGCVSIRLTAWQEFVTMISSNCLWEFHQVCNFGAVVGKNELIAYIL